MALRLPALEEIKAMLLQLQEKMDAGESALVNKLEPTCVRATNPLVVSEARNVTERDIETRNVAVCTS